MRLDRNIRRVTAALIGLALLAVALPVPVGAATETVSGTLVIKEKISLSSKAVAVVTLVDQTASADAGAILGQQRIDGPGQSPIAFSVAYDGARIDTKHSYALFATVIDASATWQAPAPVPVITGGPTSGVTMNLGAAASGPATIKGTIVASDRPNLSAGAVAMAILVKADTGAIVSGRSIPTPGQTPISFSLPYDPATIDPAASYVVKAAIVDGASAWENRAGVAAISEGAPAGDISVSVALQGTAIPTPTPRPTLEPTVKPTVAPTEGPTEEPTEAPTERPSPTAKPTATPAPTEAPTAAPTPTPKPTPEPTPTAVASASATARPSPSPTAPAGSVTGSLTYAEPAELSAGATAIVVLVAGNAKPTEDSVVASQLIPAPGQVPVAFELAYESGVIDADVTYTVQAAIVDGARAWATSKGVPVVTKGHPSSGVEVKLAYRPDLVKGEVTGGITGVGINLSAGAYAAAVLVRPDTGETLGISFDPAPSDIPIPFSIAFDPAAIDPESDYVVKAAVVAGDQRWENAAGVPVITKGNQLTGVTITVSEVVEPTPTPAPEPTATPAPSPVPEPDEDGLGTTGLLVLLAAAVAAIVGVGAFLVGRRSGGAGPGPDGGETPGETGPGTGPDGEPPVGDAVTEDVPTGEDPTGDAASAPAAALEEDVPAAATPAPGTEEVPDQARE